MGELEGFRIRRSGGKAIYRQLYEELTKRIASGALASGAQLPTEKALATDLGVSRNTVSTAYAWLERERLAESIPGRGTFVLGADRQLLEEGHREHVDHLFDLALEEALNSGFSLEAYVRMFQRHVRRRRETLRQTRVWFVECNQEQLSAFASAVGRELGVETIPVLLDDLRRDPKEALRELSDSDLVLTSAYHGPEVMGLLPRRRIGTVALQPKLDSLIEIARIPDSARIGLFCMSERFAKDIAATLSEARLQMEALRVVRTEDKRELRRVLRELDAAIVSPGRRQNIEALAPAGLKLIEFVYVPHPGSLNLIRMSIVEKQKKS